MNLWQPTSTAYTFQSPREPVPLTLTMQHCRAVADDEDDLIRTYIAAARGMVEHDTGLCLIERHARYQFQHWPDRVIELPLWPVQSITAIRYIDDESDSNEIDDADYLAHTDARPAAIHRLTDNWPDIVAHRPDAVTIELVAGFDNQSNFPPDQARQAILMLTAHWYKNRESAVIGTTSGDVAMAYDRLVESLKLRRYP
ncbi:Phage gp6-like head-tail connector protein [Crateriforma conspicua]|uniref:Phage gp6-like head-tail connector protein n=1 Tax=Crateriforma conspicua TaxID=2527996 RepID=A0A5C6G098_9PLAN|nr:head-tail connector protein [Crateriforma conspicua]TWU67305.1 Phage gp6-like head-tail connector protein [Crateriforma conspicua]